MKKADIVSEVRKDNKLIIRYKNGRTRVLEVNEGPCMTQQQYRDQQDINLIMKKYNNRISNIPDFGEGQYVDLVGYDYEADLNRISRAQDAFAELPSEIRQRFDNRPGKLLEFLDDPKNKEEGLRLGLFKAKSEPVPTDTDRLVSAINDLKPKTPAKPSQE